MFNYQMSVQYCESHFSINITTETSEPVIYMGSYNCNKKKIKEDVASATHIQSLTKYI
jgi:hypothetical protein